MRPEDQDLAYLWDMQEASKDFVMFVKGVKYSEFIQKRMIRFAVERQLPVVGEAAKHVTEQFREAHPEISWDRMIGLRNILAHEYGEIKVDRIWTAATVNVPELLLVLQSLIPDVD